jgi:hypothetical protein
MKVPAVIQRTLDGAAGVGARIGIRKDSKSNTDIVEWQKEDEQADNQVCPRF